MPRKVVLIGNYIPDRQESMLRFERALADGYAARGLSIEVWRPEPFFVRLTRQYRYGGWPKYLGYADKFVRFPRTLRRRVRAAEAGTVFHIVDHGNAVYAPHLAPVPLVVTCHDLLQIRSALGEFPQNRLSRSGQKYQRWILKSLAGLRRVACVSAKTRTDLLRLTGLPETAVRTVPNGLNYPFHPVKQTEAGPLLARALAHHSPAWPGDGTTRPPFLFSIGGAQWYKNRTGLLRIFGELKKRLTPARAFVYVGPPFDPDQQALVASLGLQDCLLHLRRLDDETLRAAYSLADGLVFPSWEEGFGWPIAEAQACGCPVFTSARPPMNEIGGEGAGYFDPADPVGAADAIMRGLALPEPMRTAGLIHAQRWAPQIMLDAYLELYDRALQTGTTPSSPVA